MTIPRTAAPSRRGRGMSEFEPRLRPIRPNQDTTRGRGTRPGSRWQDTDQGPARDPPRRPRPALPRLSARSRRATSLAGCIACRRNPKHCTIRLVIVIAGLASGSTRNSDPSSCFVDGRVKPGHGVSMVAAANGRATGFAEPDGSGSSSGMTDFCRLSGALAGAASLPSSMAGLSRAGASRPSCTGLRP